MRDLYKTIGIAGPTADTDAIRRALGSLQEQTASTRAAQAILLNPTRKRVYDRSHTVLCRIGQLRANLGLSRAPHWLASDYADFDAPPSGERSQLDALRRRVGAAQPPSSAGQTQGYGWLATLTVVLFLLLGIIVIVLDKPETNLPDNRYSPRPRSQKDYSVPQAAVPSPKKPIPSNDRYSPTLRSATEHSPPQPPVPTREEHIRSLVQKRVGRAGRTADLSSIEPLVKKLVENRADPLPTTGILTRGFFGAGTAPLGIKTRTGSNYFVKLVDWTSKREMLTVFIRGGEPFETKVPIGSYEIKYAVGESWYGLILDFGEGASYSRCVQRFDFTDTAYGYTGYTIELILQVHGNLQVNSIAPEEF